MHRQAEAVSVRSHEWQHKSLTLLFSDLLSLVFLSSGWLNLKWPSSLLCSVPPFIPSFSKMDGQQRREWMVIWGEVTWEVAKTSLASFQTQSEKKTSDVKHERSYLTLGILVWHNNPDSRSTYQGSCCWMRELSFSALLGLTSLLHCNKYCVTLWHCHEDYRLCDIKFKT